MGKVRRKSGFAKIYGEITESTLWDMSMATRLAWVTILAKCDAEGYIRLTPRSLFRLANLDTLEQAQQAIKDLTSPDPGSRCKLHGGRRLIPEDGGFQVVSHKEYRDYRSPRTIANAEYQAAHRARKSSESLPSQKAESYMSADTVSDSVSEERKEAEPKTNWRLPPPDWQPLPALMKLATDRGLNAGDELEKFRTIERFRNPTDWNLPFKRYVLEQRQPKGFANAGGQTAVRGPYEPSTPKRGTPYKPGMR